MINEQIKEEVDKLCLTIQESQEKLEELRNECKHEDTFEGYYSWRVGHMEMANICKYCRKMISYLK